MLLYCAHKGDMVICEAAHTRVDLEELRKKVLLMVHVIVIVNQYFLVFYWLRIRSACTGKQIIDLSDILAVIFLYSRRKQCQTLQSQHSE